MSEHDLYDILSEHYQEVFPLEEEKVSLIKTILREQSVAAPGSEGGEKQILDIGCADGELCLTLAEEGYQVTGIDTNEPMIHRARESADTLGLPCEFLTLDMLELLSMFMDETFDLLLCLGNTLPHLKGPGELKSFFQQAAVVLAPRGRLVLQVLNYDKIMRERPAALPKIETESIIFTRSYEYPRNGNISFVTTLTLKDEDKSYHSSTELSPFLPGSIKEHLKDAGFTNIESFGSYYRSPATDVDFFHLISAEKK